MNQKMKLIVAIVLTFSLISGADLMARGFGGGGRGGGAKGGGASASRGGASKSRGGASASRGSASASRGGATASRGGPSTGGRSAAGKAGGKTASGPRGGSVSAGGARGGVKGPSGGAAGGVGGVQVEGPGGRTASKGGAGGAAKGSGGATAGKVGGGSVSGPRGGSVTAGGAAGAARGPSGGAAGGVGGAQVEGPGGRTATKGGAGGVAAGPGGAVAGQARGGSVTGARGSISGGEARAAGRSLSTDAGLSKYRGGVSVRGASGATAHRTRSVTTASRHTRGTTVRRNVGTRYGNRRTWYSADWYAKHTNAWRAAGLTTAAIWAIPTWNSLSTWWGASTVSQPVYYDYGNTIVYEGDTVYNGTEPVATAEDYYQEASQIAAAGEAGADASEEWISLGVWAMVQGDQTESDNILQLAVNKEGAIAGNHYQAAKDVTQPIQGAVSKETQRAAWTVGDNTEVVCETGVANLTNEETEMLIHYGADRTEQWTLVRLEEPEGSE